MRDHTDDLPDTNNYISQQQRIAKPDQKHNCNAYDQGYAYPGVGNFKSLHDILILYFQKILKNYF